MKEKTYIKVSHYFYNQDNKNRSKSDNLEYNKIQKELDSFDNKKDQYEYLYNRRQSAYNRNRDFIIFGIPEDAEIDPIDLKFDEKNKYYKQQNDANGNPINFNSKKYRDREDLYTKRDRHGNIKYDRNGVKKQYGKLAKAGINAGQNLKNSKAAKILKFILLNFFTILKIIVISFSLIIIVILIIYVSGLINSIGKTPFVICTRNETKNNTTIVTNPENVLENAEGIEQALDPDYKFTILIKNGLEHGWKENAIKGLMSYIMGESSNSFVYECYYCGWLPGPSGGINSNGGLDVTLDNQAWLDWMENVYKDLAHEYYYGPKLNSSHYAACGLGICQWTDTWEYDGSMGSTGATDLINAATEDGKYWQDTEWQVDYIFNNSCSDPSSWDDDGGMEGVDPTTSDLSVEEWSDRFTCGIGMPGWNHNTIDKDYWYYANHHNYDEAEEKYNELVNSDAEIIGLVQSSSNNSTNTNVCEGTNSVPIYATETLSDICLVFSSGDTYVDCDEEELNDKNLNELKDSNSQIKSYINNISSTSLKSSGIKNNELTGKDICKNYFSVGFAIKSSNIDSSFPISNLEDQITYLSSSENWEYIGYYEDIDCEPGDILIKGDGTSDGDNIKIYIGSKEVKRMYPGSNAVFFESNYTDNGYSINYFPVLTEDNGYSDDYEVYRYID